MNVLFLSPAFPGEMPHFVAGLAALDARVFGVGEQPEQALPALARDGLTAYTQVPSIMDEEVVLATVVSEAKALGLRFDRVESLWEPLMLLAARLREALSVPGMSVEQTVPFRDKEAMKQVLDRAGILTPRHAACASAEQVRQAAAAIGYPLIVKPIDGAGSADTHRVDDATALESVLDGLGRVPQVSVEEFIEGEEFTFDTICAGGQVLFHNICWYRPRPLIARTVEWMDSQTIALRDPDAPELAAGREIDLQATLAMADAFGREVWMEAGG